MYNKIDLTLMSLLLLHTRFTATSSSIQMTTSSSSSSNENGYLEIVLGPMFSGKTSKLIEVYNQYTFCGINVVAINHCADTRYDQKMLSNHNKHMIPCIQTCTIDSIWNYCDLESAYTDVASQHMELRMADVILINEAQFFEDLVPCVTEMLKDKKKIYLYGLDGDFQRKKFGTILDLIPICDKVTKLNSLCYYCKNGEPGIFSIRLTQEKEQVVIGSDNYVPVCRKCYDIKS